MQDFAETAFMSVEQRTMKMRNTIIPKAAALLVLAAALQSCFKDDDNDSYSKSFPNAVVTVKPSGDTFYLQLDDSTVIRPTNLTKSPFGDSEVRAFANIELDPNRKWTPEIETEVNWMKKILTKDAVVLDGTLSESQLDEQYGKDPVELVKMWTVCEDGYLSLQFRTLWGRYTGISHEVNLLTGIDPDDPYLVEFRHNANGDSKMVVSDGYVAFRLDKLPDTGDKTVTLKVRYKIEGGTKTLEFKYKTRPATEG